MKKLLLALLSLSVLTSELASAGRLTGRRPSAAVAAKSALVRGSQVDVYRSNSQDALLNEEESEVQAGVKSASQGATSSVIGQVYSNISLAGRRFSFEIEEVALNADNKPVVRGWMCRIGNSANRSSSISVGATPAFNNYLASESMQETGIRSEYCGSNVDDTKKSFEIEIFTYQDIDEQLTFTLTHNNDNYNDPNNRYKSFSVSLGSLRSLLGAQIEAIFAEVASTQPTILPYRPEGVRVTASEIVTLEISSYEMYTLGTSQSGYVQTAIRMCGEKNVEGQVSQCLSVIGQLPQLKMNHDFYEGEVCPLANMSTATSDQICAQLKTKLYKSYLQKRFRPVDFGMTPGSYTIYYKSSYGHIVSTVIEVVE